MLASKTTRHSLSVQKLWRLNVHARAFLGLQKMHVMTKQSAFTASSLRMVSAQVPVRFFAGSLPDHVTLEMPNLSPTMEKVRMPEFVTARRETLRSGIWKSATRSSQVLCSQVSRLIKLPLTLKCRKMVSLQSCSSLKELRTFLLVHQLLSLLTTKKTSKHSQTMRQVVPNQRQLSLLKKLRPKNQHNHKHQPQSTQNISNSRCQICRLLWRK